MELEPFTRAFLDAAPLGVLVVDADGFIQACNPAAARIFGYSDRGLVGLPIETVIPERFRHQHFHERADFLANPAIRPMGAGRELTALRRDGVEIPVEVGLGHMEVSGFPATICFVADISVRRRIAEENERLVIELRAALEEVKRLSGLLPICASCKRIRNESGSWSEVEVFIRDRTDAQFSHGICPDCAHRLYPEYFPTGADQGN